MLFPLPGAFAAHFPPPSAVWTKIWYPEGHRQRHRTRGIATAPSLPSTSAQCREQCSVRKRTASPPKLSAEKGTRSMASQVGTFWEDDAGLEEEEAEFGTSSDGFGEKVAKNWVKWAESSDDWADSEKGGALMGRTKTKSGRRSGKTERDIREMNRRKKKPTICCWERIEQILGGITTDEAIRKGRGKRAGKPLIKERSVRSSVHLFVRFSIAFAFIAPLFDVKLRQQKRVNEILGEKGKKRGKRDGEKPGKSLQQQKRASSVAADLLLVHLCLF
ncbi:hypothetical protein niasHT_033238 [Heterodera trifolii]|uniref:Uncharacterized protein n=1 Tax=Heterodera trifolii TaxID=157864 RepID=A0ABD2IW45_9BILA